MTTNGFLILASWMALGLLAVQADDLTCSISVPSLKPKNQGLHAELVIKNGGRTPIRICTLCGKWSDNNKGSFNVYLTPHHWKSDAPTLEQSAESIVTIQPGGVARIPFQISTDNKQQILVKAYYSVSPEFAAQLHIWSGSIGAPPIDLKLEQ